jgi:hypothetical protein
MRLMIAMVLLAGAMGTGCRTEKCQDVGGTCVLGSQGCPNRGTQECHANPDPGGFYCCLPCPSGTKSNDAGTACE